MKVLNSKFAAFVCLVALAGCNNPSSIKIDTNPDTSKVVSPGETVSEVKPDSSAMVALITELYTSYVFGEHGLDKEAVERFCTKRMAQKLQDDYEFDDPEGYAVWDFRTKSQESQAGDGLKEVLRVYDNVFTAVIVDNGVKANVSLYMACENGAYKIDAVDVRCEEKCSYCNGAKELKCPSCNGEGFIYTPDAEHGRDWGHACFDCNGRGYGHKSGNDGNPLTLGKGKVPCYACVKEIAVEVPQASALDCMASVSPEFEKKLLGQHGVRLQWVSDTKLGHVTISKTKEGVYKCVGGQDGVGNDDYLKIDGEIKVVNAQHLLFNGTVECRVSHIYKGKPYVRKGVMDFLNTKGRKFWRLQQMDNGSCVDYVDIYM